MYRLPNPVRPHPDESLPGLMMRNAEPFRFLQPERLFRRLGLAAMPLAMICQQDPSDSTGQEIGRLLGLDDAEHRRLTLWHSSKTGVNILGSNVHHELARHRRRAVYPECLAGSRHHRAVWLMDVIPACAIHGTWTVHSCPGCRMPLTWRGPGVHRCRCGFDLREARADKLPDAALRGIAGLDACFHGSAIASVGLEFGPLLQVVLRLGLYGTGMEGLINHGKRTAGSHGRRVAGFVREQRALLPEVLSVGWDMLADWPNGFHAGLNLVRSHRPPEATAGIERTFRGLHAWLFRWKKAGWGAPLAEEFARHVALSADVASNRHALSAYGSRKATRRPDMSMREAQEFLGVSALTMQRIVGRNRGMMIREAAPGVSSLLSGNEIRRLKRSNAGLLTIKGVQRVLGIGRPAFLNLESMGLVRTVPESDFLLENRAYSRSAVESLLARCIQGAPAIAPAAVADLGLVSLEGSSRSWRTIYDIVLALDGGRLRAAGIDPGKRGLRSILLDPQKVGEALPHQEALSTSSELSKVLGVKAVTLRVWRRAGFIRAEEARPIGGKDGVFYSPEAIRAFGVTFISSADLGRSEGKRPLAGLPVARDLITLGIRPVSGPSVDAAGTCLFRRSDLTADVLARVGTLRNKPGLQAQRELARSRVDLALQAVATMWGGGTSRRRNTLAFPGRRRVVHAVAGTRVSLVGRFTFHLEPTTYAKLASKDDAWVAFVPSEGPGFLLMPLEDIEWPRHVGPAVCKTKWLSMRLHPSVEERWAKYVVPLRIDGIKENECGNAAVRHTGFQDTASTDQRRGLSRTVGWSQGVHDDPVFTIHVDVEVVDVEPFKPLAFEED